MASEQPPAATPMPSPAQPPSRAEADGYDHERTQMYLELAKMSQESFFNRRSYEWKVAFGLWTAIGLITYFAMEHAASIDQSVVSVLGWTYLAIGVAWLLFWQLPTRLAFEQDKAFKHYYMHRAEGRSHTWPGDDPISWMDLVTSKVDAKRRVDLRRTAWTVGQTVFTATFLIGSWLAMTSAIKRPSKGDSQIEFKASGGTVKSQTEATK